MKEICSQCGVCCRLFLINLSEAEYKSGRYRTMYEEFGIVDDFEEAELCGANIIEQNEGGSCFYLKGKKCSIHRNRPQSCRNFFCSSKDKRFKRMIDMIEGEKRRS